MVFISTVLQKRSVFPVRISMMICWLAVQSIQAFLIIQR